MGDTTAATLGATLRLTGGLTRGLGLAVQSRLAAFARVGSKTTRAAAVCHSNGCLFFLVLFFWGRGGALLVVGCCVFVAISCNGCCFLSWFGWLVFC